MKTAKAALGIEIKDEEIRLVCLTRGLTRPKLLAARTIPFVAKELSMPLRVEEGLAAIEGFVRSLSAKPMRVVVGFSRKKVFMKTLQIPKVEADDLARALEFEMERHIPVPLREVHLAFKRLRRDQEGGAKAIVIAIQRHLLEGYLTLLARAGLVVDQVTVTPLAKSHLLGRSISGSQRGKVQLILEREGQDYNLEALRGGELISASLFSPMGEESDHYRQLLDHLAGQLQAAGLAASPPQEEALNFYYLGPPPEFIKESLTNWRPLNIAVDLPSSRDKDLPAFGGAIGLAYQGLGYYDDEVNLIYSRPETPSRPRFGPLLWVAGGLVAGVLLVFLVSDYLRESRRLAGLKSQLAKLRPAVVEVQDLTNQLNQVKTKLDQGNKLTGEDKRTLALLNELAIIIPKDAWLSRLSYQGGEIKVRGQASSSQGLVQLLERSPMLENVQFDAAITRRRDVELFSMKAGLEGYQGE
jgi:Tfp pilus assembly protein PilN